MVRLMPDHTIPLDHVFYALANPTRRAVLERLSNGPAVVSNLAYPLDMSMPSLPST